MKKIIIYTFAVIFLMFLVNCEDNTAGKRFENNEYIIAGLLHAGSYVTQDKMIFVGRTIASEGDNFEDLFIENANVKLIEFNETENDTISLQFGIDLNEVKAGYYDPTNSMLIEANKKYKIDIDIEGYNLWAETIVPKEVELVYDNGFTDDEDAVYPQVNYDNIDTEHPVKIQTPNEAGIHLYEEIYCMENYTDAKFVEVFFGGDDYPETKEDYENPLTGAPRKVYRIFDFVPQEENGEYFITEDAYQLFIQFYGKTKVTFYSTDDNYYNYLYIVNDYYAHGGVENGYGYFGSVSGKSIYTEIMEQK